MKVKKVLSGALAATMVLTAAPVTGIAVFAEGGTSNNAVAFPDLSKGEVATVIYGKNATSTHNENNDGTGDSQWPLSIGTMHGREGIFNICKGDYADYAYSAAKTGTYGVNISYFNGGDNYMAIEEVGGSNKFETKTAIKLANAKVGNNDTNWWSNYEFGINVTETGDGTLRVKPGKTGFDGPSFDKMYIFAKYTSDYTFKFPTVINGEAAVLEAECGIINDVENADDSNGKWSAHGEAGEWANNGYYVSSINTGDSLTYAYHADKPGVYQVKAFYRSGSTLNTYTWSETNNKIVSGSIQAGNSNSNETLEKTFKLVVKEAGDGTLIFAAPENVANVSQNMAMTDKFEITLVVDKSNLLTAIEEAEAINLNQYVDGTEKTAFSSALSAANTVATNYEDTLTQNEVDTAITNLNAAKDKLVPIAVNGIKVTKQPTKKIYDKKETFDATGLEVVATKNDGSEETLSSDNYEVTFDSTATGPKEATVNATVDGNSYQCTIPNLVVVDGESLNSSVTEATEKKDAHKYTNTTRTALEAALATAQTVQNDIKAANGDNSAEASGEAVTSDRVDKAAAALQEAIDNLEQLYKISVPKPATVSVKDKVEYEAGDNDETNWVYVPVATAVTVNAPKTADDKDFAGWVWSSNGKDNVISTFSTYTLYAVDDMVLTPSYNESADTSKEEIKLMCSTSWKSNKRSFTVKRSVPKNWTVIKHGVVITDEKGYNTYYSDSATDKKDFGIGTYRTKHTVSKTTANNGTFVAKLTCAKKDGWYAKAYVQYKKEGSDNVITVWSGWIHE